jgi:hypothetical protein
MISYVPAAVASRSLSVSLPSFLPLSLPLSPFVHARDFGDCLTRLSFFSFVSLRGKKRATHLSLVEIVKSAFGAEEVTEEICIEKNYRTEVSFTRYSNRNVSRFLLATKWRISGHFVVLHALRISFFHR